MPNRSIRKSNVRLNRVAAVVLLACLAFPAFAAQVGDPKTGFLDALGRFSLSLDGNYGDEGSTIRSTIDALNQALLQWDATIRGYEAAMTAELRDAEPMVAARLHVAMGAAYLDRNRTGDALREFAAANELDAGRANVYTLQGLVYGQLKKDVDAATAAFRKAHDLDPRDPVRSYQLAQHLKRIGKPDEASSALQVVRKSWQQPWADTSVTTTPFIRLGLVQEVTGVEPFFPPALYAQGFALLQQGEHERAILQFRQAADNDPLMAHAARAGRATLAPEADAMKRASAEFRDGSMQAAITHLKTAIERAPTRAEPHRILGLAYLTDGQQANGIEALRQAIRLNPGDERARLALADAFMGTEQYPAAEQILQETLKVLPDSGRARYKLARALQRQGLYDKALPEFEAAVRFAPLLGLHGVYHTMGAIQTDQQNFEGAIEAYAKAIDINPNDADGHLKLGETYFRAGRHDEALTEFAAVLILNPRRAQAYAAIAQVHLRDGQYSEVVEASRRALELEPTHQQARYALATSLIRLGKSEEGQQELQVFQRLQAESTAARSRQLALDGLKRDAAATFAKGDYGNAVELLRKVLVSDPAASSSYLDLGLALLKAGQTAEAIERLETAADLNAPLEVHRHLAEAYAALGQLDASRKAQATYEKMKQERLRRRGAQ